MKKLETKIGLVPPDDIALSRIILLIFFLLYLKRKCTSHSKITTTFCLTTGLVQLVKWQRLSLVDRSHDLFFAEVANAN